jgi:hypothetical protein
MRVIIDRPNSVDFRDKIGIGCRLWPVASSQ